MALRLSADPATRNSAPNEWPFEKSGDAPDDDEDEAHFFARRFAPKDPLPVGIERVVLIHELREVRPQVGFTRLAPLESNLGVAHGQLDLALQFSEQRHRSGAHADARGARLGCGPIHP
jgi:hypothetical protein